MTESTRPSDLVADDLPEVDLTGKVGEDQILDAMKDVIDPELGVNVVDLGLVYGVDIDDGNNLTLDMTLTMPTCPLYDYIEQQVEVVLAPMVASTTVNWVMEPMWSPHNISEDGREQLRAMGYNV
jgi:metal-sulfur cluster biosynthetic enzyme